MAESEIVGRVERRRKWTAEEKAALLAEVEAEGGRVSVVARRHGISDSLIYNWRSAWKAAMAMRSPEPVEFVPIGVIAQSGDAEPAMLATPPSLPTTPASSSTPPATPGIQPTSRSPAAWMSPTHSEPPRSEDKNLLLLGIRLLRLCVFVLRLAR